MSTQNNSTSKTSPNWIPYSEIVESIASRGETLKPHVHLSSREEKAKYLVKMSNRFHKEWKKSDNR